MKKIIAFIICVLLAFIVGWITALKCNPPLPPTVIEKEVIKYNKITKKVSAECPELECYYTAVPGLDITFLQDDEYQLDASLCERKWNRKIRIGYQQYKNIIIGGLSYDMELRPGGNVQYYRMFGRVGFGGGISAASGYGNLQAGMLFQW